MKIEELITYPEVLLGLAQKRRRKHLLFGNGFSMAYDKNIFSYNALSKFIENTDDPLIKSLFEKLNTKNFEMIMQQLDNFCEIAGVFTNDQTLVAKIKAVSERLKNSLIDAVKELHPEHVFKMPEEDSRACLLFFRNTWLKADLFFRQIMTCYPTGY